MKFSIITPSHKLTYIEELYDSIKIQSYTNWEWIIYLNGGINISDVPENIQKDENVKIYREDKALNTDNIGFLKKEAFLKGTGDILVEVDHDDMLVENCLEELFKAFQDPEIGFAYSDSGYYRTDGNEFVPYNPQFGWTHEKFKWKDKKLYTMNSFEPSAQSMAFIWYEPNHVRAWRKYLYVELGGHDEKLDVLDDQDLLIRSYLKTKFFHIPKPLYIYRITGENTWLEKNKQIQTQTVNIYHKYAFALAERDCELKGLLKIDLGGGIDKRRGYISIDQEDGDITADLNEGIPLPDNSVGIINASHILEHLKDPVKIMGEIHRVLVDGGWAMIEVPSTDGEGSRGAFQDPTHRTFWNQNSFLYYTRHEQARYIRNTTIKFQSFRCETYFPSKWWRDNKVLVVTAYLSAIKSDKKRPHGVYI